MSPDAQPNPDPTPSLRMLELAGKSFDELEEIFLRGRTPDPEELVGWQFRGINTPRAARLVGLRKFMKGFWIYGEEIRGYNCPIKQNALDAPWIAKPSDDDPKRFGFYTVKPVDATARDNAYLHALLLDYSESENFPLDPTRGLRDYLVQVDADNPDLYLGKAYFALGPTRVPISYLVLERDRPGPRYKTAGAADVEVPAGKKERREEVAQAA